MRTYSPLERFANAHCAAGEFLPHKCDKKWKRWCGGCNLVFCEEHADPTFHACSPPSNRIFPELAPKKRKNAEAKEEAG